MTRGEIWWADLDDPRGPEPGGFRPVLIVQADLFNRSSLGTYIVVALTTTLRHADAPGNVLLPAGAGNLSRESVANVSQLVTLDRSRLIERLGRLPDDSLYAVDEGLRLVLDV